MNRHVRNVHRMEPERYAKCAPVEYPPNAFRLVRVAEPQPPPQLQAQDHSVDEENGVDIIELPPSPPTPVPVNADEEVIPFDHPDPAEDGALTAAAAVATLVVLTAAAAVAARPASSSATNPSTSAAESRPTPSAANPTPST